MATDRVVADAILALKYSDLVGIAEDLVNMQTGAKEDGWKWQTDKVHGEYGLAQMIYSWAESQE